MDRNGFQTIPEWLLQMPALSQVMAENNQLSLNSVLSMQRQINILTQQGRIVECRLSIHDFDDSQHRGQTLGELIKFWGEQFQQLTQRFGKIEASQFSELQNHAKCGYLATFLQRAKGCKDFNKPAFRNNVILEIYEMQGLLIKKI